MRSLITLKALTYAPTGGIVAAATTSLPEARRHAQLGLSLLLAARCDVHAATRCSSRGYREEARAWRDWLLRAVAGTGRVQIMYGVAGERRLDRARAAVAARLRGSAPVRIGNAAVEQLQLDSTAR